MKEKKVNKKAVLIVAKKNSAINAIIKAFK